MAKQPITVTFGGDTYAFRPLNIGQIERVVELQSDDAPPRAYIFAVLAIAAERVEPAIPDIKQIEATFSELSDAMIAILKGSGMTAPEGAGSGEAPAAA